MTWRVMRGLVAIPTTIAASASTVERSMAETTVTIEVEGQAVSAGSSCSIVEAIWTAGFTLVTNVGCLGQGVCGSCRVMVNRAGSSAIEMALACETLVEAGMRVAFVAHLTPRSDRDLDPRRVQSSWELASELTAAFPESVDCRHCGGCDTACPRGIAVQRGVELAVEGQLGAAGDQFDECVMCGLCTEVCPESIDPNHLGLWARRVTTSSFVRPANLLRRLHQLERRELTVER